MIPIKAFEYAIIRGLRPSTAKTPLRYCWDGVLDRDSTANNVLRYWFVSVLMGFDFYRQSFEGTFEVWSPSSKNTIVCLAILFAVD